MGQGVAVVWEHLGRQVCRKWTSLHTKTWAPGFDAPVKATEGHRVCVSEGRAGSEEVAWLVRPAALGKARRLGDKADPGATGRGDRGGRVGTPKGKHRLSQNVASGVAGARQTVG